MTLLRKLLMLNFGVLAVLFSALTFGQSYPEKPVRLVVPFPPGGSSDTAARLIGQKLAESSTWAQPVIVENKPGANTMIAANYVAQSAPDGYTLFTAVDSTMTINPVAFRKISYTPKDFEPITLLTDQALLLTVHPGKMKARTMREFVEEVKRAPGKFNVGIGALVTQTTAELIKATTGIDLVVVPLKGGADTLKTILSGSIEAAMSDIAPYVPHIRDGRLVGIAVTKAVRSGALPDVPTIAESGYAGFDVRTWNGLFAPRGTPREVVMKINREVTQVLRLPDVKSRLAGLGLEPVPSTPEELAATIKADTQRWQKVIKDAGIKID